MFYFTCPSCNKGIKASAEQIGTRVACPKCKSPLTVPTPPAAAPAQSSPAPGLTRKGKSAVFDPSALTPEDRLRRLMKEQGHGLCADVRRCEGWIRDICGDKIKEAHLLVNSLKGRVPADLLESMPGAATLPMLLQRLRTRLEDSFGLSDSAAAWAVNAWALALGVVAENDLSLSAGVAPKVSPAGSVSPQSPTTTGWIITPPPLAPATARSSEWGTRAGEERADNVLGMNLVWCPSGKFMMGSPATDPEASDVEKPQVEVELTAGFWLGKYVVTQGEWKDLMWTKPWKGLLDRKEGLDYPATDVSWEDAQSFCKRLTERDSAAGKLLAGWEYRLPSEAEWEYACRAGSRTRYGFGDQDGELDDYGWHRGNASAVGEGYAHRVGLKKPNGWGLYDMHGNVGEWCGDWYTEKLAGGRNPTGPWARSIFLDFLFLCLGLSVSFIIMVRISILLDPILLLILGPDLARMLGGLLGLILIIILLSILCYTLQDILNIWVPLADSRRVYRGGGWDREAAFSRSAYRPGNFPSYRYSDLGFRVARVLSR